VPGIEGGSGTDAGFCEAITVCAGEGKGWEGVKYLQEVFGGFFGGLHVDDVMRW